MHTAASLASQARRLLQLGMLLFLFALFVGLAIPAFALPRLGLSTHLLGLMQALFLIATGLLWESLEISARARRAAFWLAVYGCVAPLLANLLGAILGAGNTLLPMAAGPARGSALEEQVIAILLRTGGTALIAVTALMAWGLRQLGPVRDVRPRHQSER